MPLKLNIVSFSRCISDMCSSSSKKGTILKVEIISKLSSEFLSLDTRINLAQLKMNLLCNILTTFYSEYLCNDVASQEPFMLAY